LVWSALASVVSEYAAPVTVASCLALTIVMYDGGLKSTWAGPWAMGWCRTLNVLLGASASPRIEGAAAIWGYALVIGAYTVALTLLARRETGDDVARAMNIRGCVKRMILGFIVIDACAATFAAGWMSGVAVLLLLVPTLVAARQAPMT
jgi:4-hydroxybenzoate polyprenyltransferase